MRRRDCLMGLTALPFLSGSASAQTFPERPVMLFSGYPAGGSTDIAARLVAEGMTRHIAGSRFLVDNRPGASGTVAAEWLRRQTPDGYTTLLSESSSIAIWPAMHAEGMKYDPTRDYDYVSTICTSPLVLLVSPEFPAGTLKEAMDLLRSPQQDRYNYSSSGPGSIPHIGSEILRQILGNTGSRHVPYRGGAAGVLSISKNETAWGIASVGSAAGLMHGKAVRALAVTGEARFPAFPDVPTFQESGVSGMELTVYYVMHAPLGVPKPIVQTLNEASLAALKDPVLRERYIAAGMAAWDGPNTPESTQALVEREYARYREIGARTGIKIQG